MAIAAYTFFAAPPGPVMRSFTFHPSSVERITIDFTNVFDAGESLNFAQAPVTWTRDPSGSSLLVIDTTMNTTTATAKFHVGADGENVLITCNAPLVGGLGRTWIEQFVIHIRNPLTG